MGDTLPLDYAHLVSRSCLASTARASTDARHSLRPLLPPPASSVGVLRGSADCACSVYRARGGSGAGEAGRGWASAVTPLRSRWWAGPAATSARAGRAPLPAAAVSQPVRDPGALRARFSLPAPTLARVPPGRPSPPPPRSV